MTAPVERAALVALLRSLPRGGRWSDVTESLLKHGSAEIAWETGLKGSDGDDGDDGALFGAEQLPEARDDLNALYREALRDVSAWDAAGLRMVTILDHEYPARLREIHQAPPFLFAIGTIRAEDPAIAVVGSRKASPTGVRAATSIATELIQAGVTVLSGLADGIDAAAHQAALAAGGRTVALIGTGITRYYPAKNRALQDTIADRGLILSQFWPDGPPQRHNFLMRNAVMSGYGHATVVVEAGENSGARAQARMAVEHGRPVVLTKDVVDKNEWAQRLVDRPGVYRASNTAEVMGHVHRFLRRDDSVEDVLAGLRGGGL
ncbi:DNA-processing protein DprA [uncultured Nocardioides sp.]|uniref:DNA-processing protein DprA n=1 Tax=uncultured Nocardioides sp. TaxID=198441 RepID=UPI002635BA6D|nr:DNA-processing protein DprA [uncultured Nocardioides sp.]